MTPLHRAPTRARHLFARIAVWASALATVFATHHASAQDAPATSPDVAKGSSPDVAPSTSATTSARPAKDTPDDDWATDPLPPRKDAATTALGTAAAFVPGLVVHGSGHLAAGDTRTGLRLLALEGAGIGLLATGFIPIIATGASRRIIGPAVGLTVAGVGLFAISFLSDVYGMVAPRGGVGTPFRVAPDVQTSLGYRYVYNPVFSYRHFMVQEIDYRTGPFRIHPSAWFAFDDTNARVRAHFAYRFIGPRPNGSPRATDGSFLDVDTAITRHTYATDRFATTTGEIAIAGRLDMARFDPLLRGSFSEMSFGIALQAYSYRVRNTTADLSDLVLARFGFGMYFGWPGKPRGEALVYYDHRHDGFAAGTKMRGLGSGVIGHFGAEARLFVTDHWGFAAEAAVGSAYVTGLSILFRHGAPL